MYQQTVTDFNPRYGRAQTDVQYTLMTSMSTEQGKAE